jgi:hypothetical protein
MHKEKLFFSLFSFLGLITVTSLQRGHYVADSGYFPCSDNREWNYSRRQAGLNTSTFDHQISGGFSYLNQFLPLATPG